MLRLLGPPLVCLAIASSAGSTAAAGADPGLERGCAAGTLRAGGAAIHPNFDATAFAAGGPAVCAWMSTAAAAVTTYFGRFPVADVRVVINPVPGHGVHGGSTYGDEGLIVIRLGRDVGVAELDDDWVMTHEMVHLAVPSVPRTSHWLEEGIATYVEPIARVQLGQLKAARIWGDMFQAMPQGLPRVGDLGLDETPTWGRTYWGGALFCLLADVRIHQRTGNRFGLQDALRGVLAAGGNIQQDWPVSKVFEAGDHAVGVPVLEELYLEMGQQPGLATLDPLWRRLGVSVNEGGTHLDAHAPLAAVREAITQSRS